jgi:hypothetical protein
LGGLVSIGVGVGEGGVVGVCLGVLGGEAGQGLEDEAGGGGALVLEKGGVERLEPVVCGGKRVR